MRPLLATVLREESTERSNVIFQNICVENVRFERSVKQVAHESLVFNLLVKHLIRPLPEKWYREERGYELRAEAGSVERRG